MEKNGELEEQAGVLIVTPPQRAARTGVAQNAQPRTHITLWLTWKCRALQILRLVGPDPSDGIGAYAPS